MNEVTILTNEQLLELRKKALSNVTEDNEYFYVTSYNNLGQPTIDALPKKDYVKSELLSSSESKIVAQSITNVYGVEAGKEHTKQMQLEEMVRLQYLFKKAKHKLVIHGVEYKSLNKLFKEKFNGVVSPQTISEMLNVAERFYTYNSNTNEVSLTVDLYEDLFVTLPYSYIKASANYDDKELDRAYKIWLEKEKDGTINQSGVSKRDLWLALLKKVREDIKQEENTTDSTATETESTTVEKTEAEKTEAEKTEDEKTEAEKPQETVIDKIAKQVNLVSKDYTKTDLLKVIENIKSLIAESIENPFES